MVTFDEHISQIRKEYTQKGISLDDSYVSAAKRYYDWFIVSRQFEHWNRQYRVEVAISTISKVTRIAMELAEERRINVINSSLFKEAISVFERKYKAYTGPYREPDDIDDSQ